MSLSYEELGAVVAELRTVLVGSHLNKLNAPGRDLAQLVFKGQILLIAFTPGMTRLHLIEQKLPAPPTPPAWVMKARSEILNRRLSGIDLVEGDRTVRLLFAGWPDRVLLAELFGASGRLLLLDEHDRILMPFIGRGQPGEKALPPPARTRPPGTNRFGEADPESRAVNRKVAANYQQLGAEQDLSARKRGLDRRLGKRVKKLRRRLAKMEVDLKRTRQAEALSRQAECLKFQLGAVRRGQRRISLPDPHDPDGPTLEVELDPALSPVENMNRMFSRARRLAAARGTIGQRIDHARTDLDRLRQLSAEVAMADSPAALDRLGPRLEEAGLGARPPRDRALPGRKQRRLPYRLYHSANGATILVGRSGKDNHELTFRVANGHDLWLHTRDAAGAHVIIRLERGASADEQSLLDAATLAAHHSPLKSAGKVEVTYTRVKNIRPIKGAPPGLVSVSKARTLLVRLEGDRLQRLKNDSKSAN